MAAAPARAVRSGRQAMLALALLCAAWSSTAAAQGPSLASPLAPDGATAIPTDVVPDEPQVVEVRITGNRTVTSAKIMQQIRTRAGRPFRVDQVAEDVRQLNRVFRFVDIQPSFQDTPAGRVVIFKVVERPTLAYIKFVGNEKIKEKTLAKETGLTVGDAADPYRVEDARRAIEEFYHTKGFNLAQVTIHEGNKVGDAGAIFVIHEGPKQKILWTRFVGNTIASDQRLLTQVQSKQGILWLFKGEFDKKQIEQDKDRLTAYYRGLGFFRARVGAEYSFGESGQWATVTFVIDEGPRYEVRDVSFVGNTKFSNDTLANDLKLRAGEFFNQSKMDADIRAIQDEYGGVGYIFADVQAEPRFLEQPGQLDLVYQISEGDRYRVGKINPQISGEYPHTKITTVLSRMSIQPNDIVDTRELRASENRLKACGLFEVSPQTGVTPKITFSPAEAEEIVPEGFNDSQIAQPPNNDNFRGQSPDNANHDDWLDRSPQDVWPYVAPRR